MEALFIHTCIVIVKQRKSLSILMHLPYLVAFFIKKSFSEHGVCNYASIHMTKVVHNLKKKIKLNYLISD